MLHVDRLEISLGGFVLHDITFTVDKGAYFVLLGASGVGKTLVLEAIAGLTPLRGGRILLNGQDLTAVPIQHRQLGLVYQDLALFPHKTARQNIAFGPRSMGIPHADVDALVSELAVEVGVSALLDRYPDTLSGGEAQRVALARALATRPVCLLLDEPLSALDMQSRAAMRALLRRVHRTGQTVIHVTHDYEEAVALATQVAVMEAGAIAQTGTPEQVFQHPASEFAARFVGIRNVFRGTLEPPRAPQCDTRPFTCKGLCFHIMTDAAAGPGLMMLRSEDITLSRTPPDSSAQNCFPGEVTDVAPARIGVEVHVHMGVEMTALITSESATRLALQTGARVWLSFKASAVKFLED